jgi:hypothetical protein
MSEYSWRESVPLQQATPTQLRLARERTERMKRLDAAALKPEPPPPPPPPPAPPPKRRLPDTVDQVLARWPDLGPMLNTRLIIETVAAHYGMNRRELMLRTHKRHIAFARQVAMWLSIRLIRDASLPQVGRWFGGYDHTTVMHARDKIERLVAEDYDLAGEVETMRQRIVEAVNAHEQAA